MQWMAHWMAFLPPFVTKYGIAPAFSYSNNIYYARNGCVEFLGPVLDQCEWVLWIDSDNLISFPQFEMLMEEAQKPNIDAIGGWYWIQCFGGTQVIPSAGYRSPQISDTPLLAHTLQLSEENSVEVDWMGFGFLLMKASMLRKMGRLPFRAGFYPDGTLMADDSAFCGDAKKLGYRFFVHPKVFLPHLKLTPLEEKMIL